MTDFGHGGFKITNITAEQYFLRHDSGLLQAYHTLHKSSNTENIGSLTNGYYIPCKPLLFLKLDRPKFDQHRVTSALF